MRRQDRQIVGERLNLAQSTATVTFVADEDLSAGSTLAQKTFPGPFEGTPVTGSRLNAEPEPPRLLLTEQRRKPKETSPPQGSGALRGRNRDVVGDQQKPTPSTADETLLTEQQVGRPVAGLSQDFAKREGFRPADRLRENRTERPVPIIRNHRV